MPPDFDDVLAALTAAGPDARGAVGLLAADPRTLTRFTEYIWSWRTDFRPLTDRIDAAAERVRTGVAEPGAVALTSLHRNGYRRADAVAAMGAEPIPEYAPFLALRVNDWVEPIRKRATAALDHLLATDPALYLPALIPIAEQLRRRRYARRIVTDMIPTALAAAPRTVWRDLHNSREQAVRRFAYDVGEANGWFTDAEYAAMSLNHPDPRLRRRAARITIDTALAAGDLEPVHALARTKRADLRAMALAALLRTGDIETPAAHLTDPAALVRALAREATRRSGRDPLAAYRAGLATDDPNPVAITALAESGGPPEGPRIAPLIRHHDPTVRRAAVNAAVKLGAIATDGLLALLDDPDGRVVTAAARGLAGRPVPETITRRMRDAPDAHRRRVGYRLFTATASSAEWLAAALRALDEPDAILAGRALGDVRTLVRNGDLRRRRGGWTATDRGPLMGLAVNARAKLGEITYSNLMRQLARAV